MQNFKTLQSQRLVLEPVTESHQQEVYDLYSDKELHAYVDFGPLTVEYINEKCKAWSSFHSPDMSDLWLNWLAREKDTGKIVAHFQVTVKTNFIATIGYLVAKKSQGQGIATEGLNAVLEYLRMLQVKEIRATMDSRNIASHKLARKLGMQHTKTIKDANQLVDGTSDELIFSIEFHK